jgi:hypothetical protein
VNRQLHIRSAANAADRERIAQILAIASDKFVMINTTVTSRVPETICCYSESYKGGFCTGARVEGEMVIVDLGPGRVPSPRFPEVESHLIAELGREFGNRLHIANEAQFIKWQSTLPESEAYKEYVRQRIAELNKPIE